MRSSAMGPRAAKAARNQPSARVSALAVSPAPICCAAKRRSPGQPQGRGRKGGPLPHPGRLPAPAGRDWFTSVFPPRTRGAPGPVTRAANRSPDVGRSTSVDLGPPAVTRAHRHEIRRRRRPWAAELHGEAVAVVERKTLADLAGSRVDGSLADTLADLACLAGPRSRSRWRTRLEPVRARARKRRVGRRVAGRLPGP